MADSDLVTSERRRFSTFRTGAQTWFRARGLILVLFWVVGQVARDSTWLSGLCFYIPSALVAALLIGESLACLLRRRWQAAACAACLAAPPLGIYLLVENHWFSMQAPAAPSHLRIVHWNVAGHLQRPGAQDVLLANSADLYVLSEIPDVAAVEALCQALGTEFQAEVFSNMAVVCRQKIRADGWLINCNRTRVQKITWLVAERAIVLLVVDLPSDLLVHRDPLLREVNDLIEQYRPDLVIGDFNAPRRSWALCRLPAGYRHAYDSAGVGCGDTWPVPAPMYSLDHCIHSAAVAPVRYVLSTSTHSDHRLQVFDFALKVEE